MNQKAIILTSVRRKSQFCIVELVKPHAWFFW
jgi:hypothetical protein